MKEFIDYVNLPFCRSIAVPCGMHGCNWNFHLIQFIKPKGQLKLTILEVNHGLDIGKRHSYDCYQDCGASQLCFWTFLCGYKQSYCVSCYNYFKCLSTPNKYTYKDNWKWYVYMRNSSRGNRWNNWIGIAGLTTYN